MAWLDALNSNLTQTRDSTREGVTAVTDDLSAKIERLTQANQALQRQLEAAELLVVQLQRENTQLRH